MENMHIKVKYKELLSNGIEALMTKTFRSWNEDGSYTIFYEGYSEDTASFIIPTNRVISIEIIRE